MATGNWEHVHSSRDDDKDGDFYLRQQFVSEFSQTILIDDELNITWNNSETKDGVYLGLRDEVNDENTSITLNKQQLEILIHILKGYHREMP